MSTRKTIEVETIKHTVNRMIAAPGSTHDGRVALGVFLSSLLMETGNYQGFNYLAWTKEGGFLRWSELQAKADTIHATIDMEPFLGDQSRVEFY